MKACQVTEDYVISISRKRWGIDLRKMGDEWHGACFNCRCGDDRFMVFQDGGYYCRQCGTKGWLDEEERQFKPSPVDQENYLNRLAQRKWERLLRSKEWQDGWATGTAWKDWHNNMNQDNIQWWKSRGFTDWMIDYYMVGFNPSKTVKYGHPETKEATLINVPVYTFPSRNPNDWDSIRNIHFRIVSPPSGCGKYRMVENIIPYPFFASPQFDRKAIIVEGASKAAVCFDYIDGRYQIIGNSGMDLCPEVIEEINRDYDETWIALDPGPFRDDKSLKMRGQLKQARIVALPGKPDDLFLQGMQKDEFFEYLRLSK